MKQEHDGEVKFDFTSKTNKYLKFKFKNHKLFQAFILGIKLGMIIGRLKRK